MKKNYNTLQVYLLDFSIKNYKEETVNGLFRSILEPIVSNQKFEGCVFFRLKDLKEKDSLIKRLSFSNANLFGFNDLLSGFNIKNFQKDDIWGETEFLIVIGKRYSACIIWDFSLGEIENTTPLCVLYNSKIITEIAKTISDNSIIDLKPLLSSFVPDRRENSVLNKSINNIVYLLDEVNSEFSYHIAGNNQNEENEENIQTAKIVADKAKFVAHEIKNNLSIVNLYTKIIEKRLEKIQSDEENFNSISGAIKNIEKASFAISYFISDLRCMSTPFITNFDLDFSVKSVINLCEEKAKQKNITIENKLNSQINVSFDKAKFECALMNIIFNAIEAQNTSKIVLDVRSDLKKTEILILNDGCEIPVEIQNKIFEQDFTTKDKGNGIGLAYCQKQLREVLGDITLEKSQVGQTVFKITIPQ